MRVVSPDVRVVVVNLIGGALMAAEIVTGLAMWDSANEHAFKTATDIVLLLTILTIPLAALAIVSAKGDAREAMLAAKESAAEAMLAAKRDLVEERRISFELDTLRELGAMIPLEGGGQMYDEVKTARKVHALVMLLPDRTQLPLTRAALRAAPTDQALRHFDELFDDRHADWTAEHRADVPNRFAAVLGWERFRDEVQDALERTVNR